MRKEISEEGYQDIVDDYAKRGIVVTKEEAKEQVRQLVEIMKLAYAEGLIEGTPPFLKRRAAEREAGQSNIQPGTSSPLQHPIPPGIVAGTGGTMPRPEDHQATCAARPHHVQR